MEEKVSEHKLADCPDCQSTLSFARANPPDGNYINQEVWCEECSFAGRVAYIADSECDDNGTWKYLPEDDW